MPRAMTVSCVAASISRMLSERSLMRTGSTVGTAAGTTVRIATGFSGLSKDGCFVLIYTMRGSAMRIISARKANKKEVLEYEHGARQD